MNGKVKTLSLQQYSDSRSLWNYTLSPGTYILIVLNFIGWTSKEVEIYRLVLMKHGIGKWAEIERQGYLPHKTANQLNMQLQRMLGQQSTAEFFGLHIDPRIIYSMNILREGSRKNGGCLINSGNNPDKAEVKRKRNLNRSRYELDDDYVNSITIPMLKSYEISGSRKILGKEAEKISQKLLKLRDLAKISRMLESHIYLLNNKIKLTNISVGDVVENSMNGKGEVVGYNTKGKRIIGYKIQFVNGKYKDNLPGKLLQVLSKAVDPLLNFEEAVLSNEVTTKFKPGDRILVNETNAAVVAKVEPYCVTYDDGGYESNIEENSISMFKGEEGKKLNINKKRKRVIKSKSELYEVNERVEVRYKKGKEYFLAVIVKLNEDTCDVKYDDDEVETEVKYELVQKIKNNFEKYDRISYRNEDGSIDDIVGDKFKLKLDNGKKVTVKKTEVEALTREKGFFKPKQNIECLWKNGIHWYKGIIKKENKNGTYAITYEDGDFENFARSENIRELC